MDLNSSDEWHFNTWLKSIRLLQGKTLTNVLSMQDHQKRLTFFFFYLQKISSKMVTSREHIFKICTRTYTNKYN